MKTVLIAALIAAAVSTPVRASDPWSTTDVALEAVVVTLLAADWYTSRIAQGRGYEEANPLLGRRPGPAKLNLYSAVVTVGHLWVADSLSSNNRKVFQALTITTEAFVVKHNLALTVGVRAGF